MEWLTLQIARLKYMQDHDTHAQEQVDDIEVSHERILWKLNIMTSDDTPKARQTARSQSGLIPAIVITGQDLVKRRGPLP